ncbi:MAG: ABC transporter ATP-binding protein [Bacilli bacterium]|jgi:ATP-binding cassette subfamily B protein
MIKLIKYLKPFVGSIIIIIGMLFIQAMCDLSLPQYMSNIVNVGIQQNGINKTMPEVIRESEWNKVMKFLSEADRGDIESLYKLLDKEALSTTEYNGYVKEYPLLEEEALYKLNTGNSGAIDNLSLSMAKSLVTVYGIEQGGLESIDLGISIPTNTDPFMMINNISAEQFAKIKDTLNIQLAKIPETILTQMAVLYMKGEYEAIGININDLQTHYISIEGLKMIGIALLSMVTSVAVGFIAAHVSTGLGRNLRKGIFKKVVGFSNAEFDKFGSSSLITRTTNDIQQVQGLIVMLLRIVFYAPILGIGGVLKVLATDTSMGWIVGVAIAAISIVVISLFIFAVPKFKIIQKLIDKLNLVTRESLTGMLVIRAFNTEKYEEKKFDKANKDLTKTNRFITRILSIMSPLMMLIMNIIAILIVWIGAHQIDGGAIQVGDMMAFIQYAMQIIMAFLMITMISIALPRAAASIGRIDEVLATDSIIEDPLVPKPFRNNTKGYIKFNNVSFRYEDADDYVIKNISFEARAGETIAFIGSTGSGKSTIVNLLPRFYDVTEGQILIDGTDIRDVTQHELRNKIGYVPQKGVLF